MKINKLTREELENKIEEFKILKSKEKECPTHVLIEAYENGIFLLNKDGSVINKKPLKIMSIYFDEAYNDISFCVFYYSFEVLFARGYEKTWCLKKVE